MRNPYIVGSWVSGVAFYGHQRLIETLLEGADNNIWVVGTRRVGKTSLLRQVELLARTGDRYAPLFWDMQGCESEAALCEELYYALEDAAIHFSKLGVNVAALAGFEIRALLRALARASANHGRELLLLIDEPEVLIEIGKRDPAAVQRLRKALQGSENQRTIIASTKGLSQLNDLDEEWQTSPFLYGFALRNLSSLHAEAAEDLIRQRGRPQPVSCSDHTLDAIRNHTNNHPYLIQWMCSNLFQEDGYLRHPTPQDICIDDQLDSYFRHNYQYLSQGERNTLAQVAAIGTASLDRLAQHNGLTANQLHSFLYSLDKLGYVRTFRGQYAVGNDFLAEWLRLTGSKLEALKAPVVSDRTSSALALRGRAEELTYWGSQLQAYTQFLDNLLAQRAQFRPHVPPELAREIRNVEERISAIAERIEQARTM